MKKFKAALACSVLVGAVSVMAPAVEGVASAASGCSFNMALHNYPLDVTKWTSGQARCTGLDPGEWVIARITCHDGHTVQSPKDFIVNTNTLLTFDDCWRRFHTYADFGTFVNGFG